MAQPDGGRGTIEHGPAPGQPAGLALAIGLGYLVGSIPYSQIVARMAAGVDLRRVGSGNVGAFQVMNHVGHGAGLLAGALDLGKGIDAVLCSRLLGLDPRPAAVGAVLGHSYPVWLSFRGGKGGATSVGALCALMPRRALDALAGMGWFLLVHRNPAVGIMGAMGIFLGGEARHRPLVVALSLLMALKQLRSANSPPR